MPALPVGSAGTFSLRGIVPAALPALLGTVVFDASSAIPIEGNPGLITVVHQIVRSQTSGLLHFTYGLAVVGADWDLPVSFAIAFDVHSAPAIYADFRVDSPGGTPPNTVEVKSGVVTFRFNYGISVDKPSYTFFVSAAAREFRDAGTRITLTAGSSLQFEGPSPIAMPMRPVVMPQEPVIAGQPDDCLDGNTGAITAGSGPADHTQSA